MSSAIRSPGLGPIIGHTTATSVRVWMRAQDVGDAHTVGVAVLQTAAGKTLPKTAHYFRLRREHDRTGTADFSDLTPDTTYGVLIASLTLHTDDPLEMIEDDEIWASLPPAESWVPQLERLDRDEAFGTFTTCPAEPVSRLSFVFGSCRYPGLLWLKKKADVIFKSIHEHVQAGPVHPRFFMMVGDQIYADVLPKDVGIVVADTEAEFRERYEDAFGAPNTRKLLRSIPTYMILDDHEIEDNWVQGRIAIAAKRELFHIAIQAYRQFQWSHSPRNYGEQLFYDFEVGGFPFFVIDGRTQRLRDDDDYDLTDNHLLGRPALGKPYKGQIDVLCDWLVAQQKAHGNRPKFIVTASVFVPNEVRTVRGDRQKAESDSWAAFPLTRQQLLETITSHSIQNVVFLAGDIHCSNVAEIEFYKDGQLSPLKAHSVVSSAFYWPYPFADGNPLDYVHDSHAERDDFDIGGGWEMRYRARAFQQEDNFTRVDIDLEAGVIRVANFDRRGELISGPHGGPQVLRLAP